MVNLAIRITSSYYLSQHFFPQLNDICDQTIWYEHVGDDKVKRTHLHGLIMNCKVSTDTLKNWISKFNNRKFERSDWSFKQSYKINNKEEEVNLNFITYMSKGRLQPVYVYNIDDYNGYKDLWVDKETFQPTLHKFKQNDKLTKWQMLNDLKERMNTYSMERRTDETILSCIIDIHREQKQLISRYKIRDFYDSYKAIEDKDNFIEELKNILRFNK